MRIVAFLIAVFLTACSALTHYPEPKTQQQRFDAIAGGEAPVQSQVRIYWNDQAVPFVEAENSEDLAFGVGVVHAHLRLGQMAVMKMIAQGRISEMVGPVPQLVTIDHGLRMLDLCGSGERSLAVMAPEGRAWMSDVVRGINWYMGGLQEDEQWPSEYHVLNLERRRFSEQDLMCIARLVSADLTWPYYLKMLKLAEQSGWEEAFNASLYNTDSMPSAHITSAYRTLSRTSVSEPSQQDPLHYEVLAAGPMSQGPMADSSSLIQPGAPQASIDSLTYFQRLLESVSKSGSNSLVVSGDRSESGAALIASDPHVGLLLPNFWLLIGLHSPDYQATGLMIPGVPIIGVGRNRNIAWGGTNMRAISSHLMDVSELDESDIQTEYEYIQRRGWWRAKRQVRRTEYGPILTDLGYFDSVEQPFEVALDWVGRQGSDEISAFLAASRAYDWSSFRKAFAGYQVSAFNMLYADRGGNIGMVPAYGQPVLHRTERTLDLVKSLDNRARAIRPPLDQANPYNPSEGFIASANNRPFERAAIPYSYQFSNSDRYARMRQLMEGERQVNASLLKAWQRDSLHPLGKKLASLLEWNPSDSYDNAPTNSSIPEGKLKASARFMAELNTWDGRFSSDNRGALVFEALKAEARTDWLASLQGSSAYLEYMQSHAPWEEALHRWLEAMPENRRQPLRVKWTLSAIESVQPGQVWGDVHRQQQSPPLGMIPLIGRRYRLPDYPGEGNNDTLFKGARQPGVEKQSITYGSSARHVSDLSDINANWFVLHGGQDGWFGSPNLADQTELWRKGEYIQMPLQLERVKAAFNRFETQLTPNGR